jgi:hypothetical protein
MASNSPRTSQDRHPSREADSYTRGDPVTGVRLLAWLALPPTSGLECAAALRRAGFRLRPSPPGIVDLTRDHDLIRVPLARTLAPQALITILQRAGIQPGRFLELLDDIR